jgi:hypothetical protein
LAQEDSERTNFSHVLTTEATIFENFAAREDDADGNRHGCLYGRSGFFANALGTTRSTFGQ